MKLYLLLFIPFLTAICQFIEKDSIQDLKGKLFHDWLFKFKTELRVIWFYAPWSKDCKVLSPQFSKLAEIMKDSGAKFARLDATLNENQDIVKQLEVKIYPAIKFYLPDEITPNSYKGFIVTESILSYLQGKLDQKEPLVNLSDVQKFRDKYPDSPIIIGVFPKQTQTFQWFQEIQQSKMDYFRFIQVRNENPQEILQEFQLKDEGVVTIFPQFISNNFTSKEIFESKQDFQK